MGSLICGLFPKVKQVYDSLLLNPRMKKLVYGGTSDTGGILSMEESHIGRGGYRLFRIFGGVEGGCP